MKQMKKIVGAGALMLVSALYLISCSMADNPVAPETGASEYTVTVRVEPPEFLRTEETWNRWKNPVEVSYAINSEGTFTNNSSLSLDKRAHEDSTADQGYIGARHAGGMDVMLGYGGGRDLYSMHAGGMMDMHHPESGAHHYMVQIYNDSTISGEHFAMPIPGVDVILLALSKTDTFTYQLNPVMGGHGYRYEANTELPDGTYDLRLQVAPPDVYRTEETRDFWTIADDIEFHAFAFDSTYTPAQIGNQTVVNTSGDSIHFALAAEDPEAFGTMGMGWTALSGNETIRFAVGISDPAIEIDQIPIYNSQVRLTVQNDQTGESETKTLNPIYGPHGFYYGENFMTEMMGDTLHGPAGGHGSGMGMGGM